MRSQDVVSFLIAILSLLRFVAAMHFALHALVWSFHIDLCCPGASLPLQTGTLEREKESGRAFAGTLPS